MINSLNYKGLRNGEFTNCCGSVIDVAEKEDLEKLEIQEQVNNFSAKHKELYSGYNFKQGSKYTEILSNLDGGRDNCVNGICKILEGYLLHYDTGIVEAAALLKKEFDNHGKGIDRFNYHTETITIEKITDAVRTNPELTNAAATLNLTDWFNYKESLNIEFKTTHLQRLDEVLEFPYEKTLELRKETTALYQELIKHIEAHITLKGIADYANLVTKLNALIDEYNLIVTRRSSSKDDNIEEGEE